MADYIVFKAPAVNEPKVLNYAQYREEDVLLRGLVPGEDFVVISEAMTEGLAKEEAEVYFRGSHQERARIDCWVAGALEQQKCLKASMPSNPS